MQAYHLIQSLFYVCFNLTKVTPKSEVQYASGRQDFCHCLFHQKFNKQATTDQFAGYFIKYPTRCSFKQSSLLFTAKLLYMFRVLSAPIIRSTSNLYIKSQVQAMYQWGVGLNPLNAGQGLESTSRIEVDSRPWIPYNGFNLHRTDTWLVPVIVYTVFMYS